MCLVGGFEEQRATGSLLLCLPSVLVRLWCGGQPGGKQGTLLMTTDIYVVSLVILHWTVLLTVGISAFIVKLSIEPPFVRRLVLQGASRINRPFRRFQAG